ncbi:MAG: hypothetical protein NTZ17_20305 [Phycisphaerae bacterium]|nr:hypothetical protein [Phycisphaerae bacterium]
MAKMAILVVSLAAMAILTGCSGPQASDTPVSNAAQPPIPKSFFDRAIIYMVDPDATAHMSKAEDLVARAEKLKPPLPDDVLAALYRDADLDRNHHITGVEAKTFYESYILRFEDALGRSRY